MKNYFTVVEYYFSAGEIVFSVGEQLFSVIEIVLCGSEKWGRFRGCPEKYMSAVQSLSCQLANYQLFGKNRVIFKDFRRKICIIERKW